MPLKLGLIHQGDCLKLLPRIDAQSVDLAFADPPFNIGYKYDKYHDRQDDQAYLDWCQAWIGQLHRILKPTGTFWLAIGDEYAAELKWLATRTLRERFDQPNFIMRSWVIWYYTFGVNCTRKFNRSHAHLFQFIKDEKAFTFNAEDPAVRVPSARALVYGDSRANPTGRLPDDTWVLRPQDAPESFQPMDDTWYYSRVAGTFKERQGFHGCQMPEQLLGRIIRVSSNEGDVVFDPFTGSGTTLAVAKKLGRQFLGTELSEDYAKYATARLKEIGGVAPLDGPADPASSSPNTASGVRLVDGKRQKAAASVLASDIATPPNSRLVAAQGPLNIVVRDLKRGVVEAFALTNHGFSIDRMLADPIIGDEFVAKCQSLGLPGNEQDWKRAILNSRKAGPVKSAVTRSQRVMWRHLDECRFASEIAWKKIRDDFDGISLDDILCDPDKAREFDRIARRFSPGRSSFEYRWAALMLRKSMSDKWKLRDKLPSDLAAMRTPRRHDWNEIDFEQLDLVPGVYVLRGGSKEVYYVGETSNIGNRLRVHKENSLAFGQLTGVGFLPLSQTDQKLLPGKQVQLIERCHPRLNILSPSTAA